ncbi:rhombosortase [Vibrio sinaloensis]|nr:rhombosortase [Vibrio sinaloensis]
MVSGNFTHTNIAHLAMNLAGLWVISFIFKPSAKSLLLALSVISVCVGILNLFSDMTSYVGLSGVLHGLFAYFALLEVLHGRKKAVACWFLALSRRSVGKSQWEPPQSTSELIQARVAVEAHLFGLISGLLLAWLSNKVPGIGRFSSHEQ